MKKLAAHMMTPDGWTLVTDHFDAVSAIHEGSNFMIGNGYLGYRGTFAEARKADYAACVVTDTWDKADGKWEELSTVPNALFTMLYEEEQPLNPQLNSVSFTRYLNLKTAVSGRSVTFTTPQGHQIELKEEKFASAQNRHLVMMRYSFKAETAVSLKLLTGIDLDVWSLNGDHLKDHKMFKHADDYGVHAVTGQSKISIVVLEKVLHMPEGEARFYEDVQEVGRIMTLNLKPGETQVLEKAMLVVNGHDYDNPQEEAVSMASMLNRYADTLETHVALWEKRWQQYDIAIEGALDDQVALRFNIYHALIATPRHKPLPIGARGLSCQAYQGAAFWDQEMYNLPMYLYREPQIARQLLTYRYQTLDGARRKAQKHHYEGAFYAWISGKTGDELCPDFFFKDVLSGRDIRNHFNVWQIHISMDIAHAVRQYEHVTGDWDFIEKQGAEMVFEIARFIASRVDFKPRRNQYELIRVQGPDEYHENVDNNTFTNVMALEALNIAIHYWKTLSASTKDHLTQKLTLTEEDVTLWRDIAQRLYIPEPDDEGLIEQFDGYFRLESIVPARKVTERLINHEEYYGWPNGITVFTQCLKQADLIQLFSILPDRYSDEIMRKNYEYYEPRTLHFSSLSPSTYAIVAARLGKTEEAYALFRRSLTIDLLNTNEAVSGGTFIGGMHTAANGAAWMMVVMGFLGFRPTDQGFTLSPALPSAWQGLKTKVMVRNQTYSIHLNKDTVTIQNVSDNPESCIVQVFGQNVTVTASKKTIALT